MANLEHKEEKALEKIVTTVNKLDKKLNELDTLSENPEKKHSLEKWLIERKAIHEIKKILHEADKYEKYDEKSYYRHIPAEINGALKIPEEVQCNNVKYKVKKIGESAGQNNNAILRIILLLVIIFAMHSLLSSISSV